MKLPSKIAALFTAAALFLLVVIAPSHTVVSAAPSSPKLTATTADEWTDLFYRPNQSRRTWLGADGIFSVALNGDDSFASADSNTKTFFIFSDTLMGTSDANGRITGGFGMPSHTSALLTGSEPDKSNLRFVYGNGGNMNPDQHLFGERRWMLDCFVVNNNLYVLGFPESDWKPTQIDMYKVPIKNGEPDYANYTRTHKISQLWYNHVYDSHTHLLAYGIGVMVNTVSAGAPNPDGYIYIYGYLDDIDNKSAKSMIVSRVKESDFPNFSNTEYWDGEKWSKNITDSKGIIKDVSCEMSVSPITTGPYKGKYIAIYTQNTQGTDMMYAIGDTPYGPFDTPVKFYSAPQHDKKSADGVGTLYTYNAKAHPHLSQGDKLLVSYNCNAINPVTQHPSDYHPYFLWLDLDPLDQGDGDASSDVSSNTSSNVSSNVSSNTSSNISSNVSSNVSSVRPPVISSDASSDISSEASSEVSSEETSTGDISSEEIISSDIPPIPSTPSVNPPDSSSPLSSSADIPSDNGGSPYLWIAVVVAVLLVGAVAVLIIGRRR